LGRRLGQHFLFDPRILERIALAACPEPVHTVIEIGPGPGGLTSHLAARCERLIAIELDPQLASALAGRYKNVEVVQADVLRTNLDAWGPAVIAGNLPYYITSPIIDRVLELGSIVQNATFLVQREVAVRLAAQPGSRDYGYLTVATQARAKVEVLFAVKPGAFKPPPKVDSALVRLTPLKADLPRGFLPFVSRCFAHKRKTLANNVPQVAGQPEARLRAEQLSVAQLLDLLRRLEGQVVVGPGAQVRE
jgi:16S rRNA (adenine1518-N6/adenine1519-N6)-dimethyltransferase